MAGLIVRIAVVCLGVCGVLNAADLPGVWLDVPFVKQEKDGCGAASIAMVMQYWQAKQGQPSNRGQPSNQVSDAILIQRALYSPKAHGIYSSDMERYFQENGFRTFTIRGEWEDLKQHLEKGRPLIVALKPAAGALHYVVVTGLAVDTVTVNDPAQRKLLQQERPTFEREWSAAERWTLLALPQTPSH